MDTYELKRELEKAVNAGDQARVRIILALLAALEEA